MAKKLKKQNNIKVIKRMNYDQGKIVQRIQLSPKVDNAWSVTDNIEHKSTHAKKKKAKGGKIK